MEIKEKRQSSTVAPHLPNKAELFNLRNIEATEGVHFYISQSHGDKSNVVKWHLIKYGKLVFHLGHF